MAQERAGVAAGAHQALLGHVLRQGGEALPAAGLQGVGMLPGAGCRQGALTWGCRDQQGEARMASHSFLSIHNDRRAAINQPRLLRYYARGYTPPGTQGTSG